MENTCVRDTLPDNLIRRLREGFSKGLVKIARKDADFVTLGPTALRHAI